MAEGGDDQEKTEEPTQKRLDDARKKGQVAFSREVSNFFMILTLTLIVAMLLPGIFSSSSDTLAKYLYFSGDIRVDPTTYKEVAGKIVEDTIMVAALPFVLLIVAAISSSFVQNGFFIAADSVMPKLSKISIFEGFKRLFSLRSFMEFVKGIIKIIIVGAVAYFSVSGRLNELGDVHRMSVVDLTKFISELALVILIGVTVAVALIAILDFIYQKKEHTKKLMMSKQEIKDEYKQQEGDPIIKGKLKQIRMERARQRMMQQVPDADVVITNPTHYAIALQYKQGDQSAPIVLAMGVDKVALRIKDMANDNEIPVVRNAVLARALYDDCELDEEIPLEHYQAVAEVISYVFKLRGEKAQRG